jgi:Ca2+-binding EF-hand superfamily protein
MENMVNANSRAWAFSSFRWWDRNQDGNICSKDIFAVYQLLDQAGYDFNNNSNSKGKKAIQILKDMLEKLRAVVSRLTPEKE